MTRLASLLHLDDGEFAAARAEQEARPLPQRPAPLPAGWGRGMIAFLRAEAPVEPRTLGMRRPTAPTAPKLPSRDLIEYVTAVSVAMHADYERHLNTLRVIDQIAAAAPDPHTLAMALAPVLGQLKGLVA